MFQVVNWAALSLAENLRHIQEGPHGEIDDSNRAALEVKKKRDHKKTRHSRKEGGIRRPPY